jgi:hypothetical protein
MEDKSGTNLKCDFDGIVTAPCQRRLVLKGLRPHEIATTLFDASGVDAYVLQSTEAWLQKVKVGRIDLQTQHVGGRLPLDGIPPEMVIRKYEHVFCKVSRWVSSFFVISEVATGILLCTAHSG